MRKPVVVITSGYFDPIHSGHIECMEQARALGDRLVVIINNDEQARLKKGKHFMPLKDRIIVVSAIKFVDEVFVSIDMDKSVRKSLEAIAYNPNCEYIFAKGGDRMSGEIPEAPTCDKLGIKIVDGLGAKIQSSSTLIRDSEPFEVLRIKQEI